MGALALLCGCGGGDAGTASGGAGLGAAASQGGTPTLGGAATGGAAGSTSGGTLGGGTAGATASAAGTAGDGTGGTGGVTGGATGTAGTSGASGTAGSAAGGQAGSGPMLEPGIRWLGRVEKTATGARFSWPGTGFTARFNGTAAKLSMKTSQADYFQLVVDGDVKLLSTQSGTHDYDLAQNLTAGAHTITLWRRTEPLNGSAEVTKVDFMGGELLSPPPPSSKRLEVVGDSISVGFGVECKTIDEAFSYPTENNYQTYEAVTARDLGAELVVTAWSGIGVWRDVGGATGIQMPDRYLRTLGENATTQWDFASYTPGAVVVLLGTNDFAKGDPGQPFVDAYLSFLSGVRSRYPAARIYLVVSPMLGGDKRTAIKAYLSQIKATRSTQGDQNLSILEFAQPAQDAWGCGHPNGATHLLMASVLKQALSQDLGW